MRELLVLAWTETNYGPHFLGSRSATTIAGQPISIMLTDDRSELGLADAVWFHSPSIKDLPTKRAGQPWVLMSMESEELYPFQTSAAAEIMFDVHMSYRLDSDVPTLYANWDQYERFATPPPPRSGPSDGAVALYMASNPVASRDEYVAELMRYLPVDSVGRSLNNRDIADLGGPGRVNDPTQAFAVIRAYKFVLAFENSQGTDYVTEKLFRPLAWGTVPVYLGAPNVRDFTPTDEAVIVASDFASPRDLASALVDLDADDDSYGRHLQWRTEGVSPGFRRLVDVGSIDPIARLATKLAHGCDRSCACGGRLRDPGLLP